MIYKYKSPVIVIIRSLLVRSKVSKDSKATKATKRFLSMFYSKQTRLAISKVSIFFARKSIDDNYFVYHIL